MISKFATSEISICVASLSSWGETGISLFLLEPRSRVLFRRGRYAFEKANNRGAGATAQTDLRLCCSHSRVEANNFINGYTSSEGSEEPAQMYRIFRA